MFGYKTSRLLINFVLIGFVLLSGMILMAGTNPVTTPTTFSLGEGINGVTTLSGGGTGAFVLLIAVVVVIFGLYHLHKAIMSNEQSKTKANGILIAVILIVLTVPFWSPEVMESLQGFQNIGTAAALLITGFVTWFVTPKEADLIKKVKKKAPAKEDSTTSS